MTEREYTTLTIGREESKQLERFCKAHGMTKKDFVSLSLSYFQREGIDPKNHESPKGEITKITKRLDQFFAFFKTQENELIRPLAISMGERNRLDDLRIKTIIQNQEEIKQGINSVLQSIQVLRDMESSLSMMTEQQGKESAQALRIISQYLDPKNKSGLIESIKNVFS